MHDISEWATVLVACIWESFFFGATRQLFNSLLQTVSAHFWAVAGIAVLLFINSFGGVTQRRSVGEPINRPLACAAPFLLLFATLVSR